MARGTGLSRALAALLALACWARGARTQAPARSEEVEFSDAAVTLRGRLVLPAAAGPHPAVVLVHGSGPDEGDAYRHYAEAFADAGIAALVYDKRGSGRSGGDWRRRTLALLASDARAGAAYLRARADVRADRVGLWGISQGAWVVAHAAARDSAVAFCVAVSGGGVSPTQQEMYHKAEMFRHLGYSERAGESAVRVWRLIFDGLVLHADGYLPFPRGVMEGELSSAHFGLTYDPAGDWRRVRVPVLAVFGLEDRLTPVPETVARLRAALAAAGNDRAVIRVYPGAGHTITTRQTGLRFDWDSAFAPGYLETVTGWVREATGGPAAAPPAGEPPPPFQPSAAFAPTGEFGRLPWYGRFYVQLACFALFAIVFGAESVRGAARLMRRRRERHARRRLPRPAALASAIGATNVVILIGAVVFVRSAVFPQGMGWVESYSLPVWLRALPLLGIASAALTVLLAALVLRRRRRDAGVPSSAGARVRLAVRLAVRCAAFLAFLPWLAYWNLVGLPL